MGDSPTFSFSRTLAWSSNVKFFFVSGSLIFFLVTLRPHYQKDQHNMDEGKKIKKLFRRLCKSEHVVIPKEGRIELPETEGVYILLNKKDDVLLVGKTEGGKGGLRARINTQLFGTSPFRKLFLTPSETDIRKKHYLQYLAIESERDRILVEAYATGKLCPAFIGLKLPEPLPVEEVEVR